MLKPSIFLCAVIGILNSFAAFNLVYVMTNGGPGHATELLITYIYKEGFGQTRFDYAAALTVAQFVVLMALGVAGAPGRGRQCRSARMTRRDRKLLWAAARGAGADFVRDADAFLLGAEDLAHG